MPPMPITSAAAAFSAVMLVALSVPVTFRRIKVGAPMGDRGDELLQRRIRAQGNFTEYVPVGLVLLGLAEMSGAALGLLAVIALSLSVGRIAHAAGMLSGRTPLRVVGMALTYTALLTGAGAALSRLAQP